MTWWQKRKASGLCGRCGAKPPCSDAALCSKCRADHRIHSAARRRKVKEVGLCSRCRTCLPRKGRVECDNCSLQSLQEGKTKRQKQRTEILNYYGNKCVCCGEAERLFLELDHVNNDGAEHRRGVGTNLMGWIIRNNFPNTIQLLCKNCNWGKHVNGGKCPHKGKFSGRSRKS